MKSLTGAFALLKRFEHKLNVGHFYSPRSACFKVVKVHFGKSFLGKLPLRIVAQAFFKFLIVILSPVKMMTCSKSSHAHTGIAAFSSGLMSKVHYSFYLIMAAHFLVYGQCRLQEGFFVHDRKFFLFIPLHEYIQVLLSGFSAAGGKQPCGDRLQTVFYPFFMLPRKLVVRHEDGAEGFFP